MVTAKSKPNNHLTEITNKNTTPMPMRLPTKAAAAIITTMVLDSMNIPYESMWRFS